MKKILVSFSLIILMIWIVSASFDESGAWHDASKIKVSVGGDVKDLQSAIENDFCLNPSCGGGGGGNVGDALDLKYLGPGFESGGIKYTRIGDEEDYYGGLMFNEENSIYGNGNDFVIYSYSNRDLNLRAGTGNVNLMGSKFGIGTNNPQATVHVYNNGLNLKFDLEGDTAKIQTGKNGGSSLEIETDGGNLKLGSYPYVYLNGYSNCNLETDGDGKILCGVDDVGEGGGGGGIGSCSECDGRFVNANGDVMSNDYTIGGELSVGENLIVGKYLEIKDYNDGTINVKAISRDGSLQVRDGGVVIGSYSDGSTPSGLQDGDLYVKDDAKVHGDLTVDGSICLGGSCRTYWPSGGGGSSGSLDCTVESTSLSQAYCGSGYVLTGGGGECNSGGNLIKSSPSIYDSNKWEVECSQNGVRSTYAICCRIIG